MNWTSRPFTNGQRRCWSGSDCRMSAISRPTGFSKGMQQKMLIIIGFLLKPDVYVVDEPFVGLDPRATRDFLELLQDERRRGAGVSMCTHVLDTAEKICDRIILINSGSIVAQGTLAEVREQAGCAVDAPLTDCFYALT